MNKFLYLFLLTLVACASTPSTPPPTPEPEVITVVITATPQPTETPKALTYLDLEPILFQSGDLPSDYTKGVVTDSIEKRPFRIVHSLPEPNTATMLKIDDKAHNSVNAVVVLSYENRDDTNDGFAAMNTKDFKDLPGVGEKASVETKDISALFGFRFQNVVFTRCNMVVYLTTTADTVNYAKRLDGRLSKEFCP